MAEKMESDGNRAMVVPATMNGNDGISATKIGYISAGGIKTVNCWPLNNCSYDTSITLALVQQRCDSDNAQSATLPVIVRDKIMIKLGEEAQDSMKTGPVVRTQVKVSIKEVNVSLVASDLYLTGVSMPGFVVSRSSVQIIMPSRKCDARVIFN